MHDVFISFAFEDQKQVERIVNTLTSKYNISCWICTRDIDAGVYYKDIIPNAIDEATVVVFIQSSNSIESKDVTQEIGIAFQENKIIIPFKLDKTRLKKSFRYNLEGVDYIDATIPTFDERIDELAISICRILNRPLNLRERSNTVTETNTYALVNKIPQARNIFVGRENYISDIENFFKTGKRVLFLEGIGGIGKSECAKQYAVASRNRYDTIIFASYSDSIRDLVCSPNTIEINGFFERPGETEDELFDRKIRIFRSLATDRTLLIIDNFDVDTDPDLEYFLQGSHHVIFTTRNSHAGYDSIKIDAISDSNTLLDLFEKNYGEQLSDNDKPYLLQLFSLVGNHTYAIELLAKQMEVDFSSGKELLEKFNEGTFASSTEKIDGRSGLDTAFGHIRSLFKINNLSKDENQILRELSLCDIHGIPAAYFFKWTGSDDSKENIRNLIHRSLVRKEFGEIGQKLALHPLIREVILADDSLRPTAENCRYFLNKMTDDLCQSWYTPVKNNMAIADCVMSIADYFTPFRFNQDDSDLFYIWVTIPSFLWQVGRFDDSIRLGHTVYNTCYNICGEASMMTGFAAKTLGGCYFNSWRIKESIYWYKEGLRCMRLADTGDNECLASVCVKVARCYTWEYERDFEKAEKLFQESLEIRKNLKERVERGEILYNFEERLPDTVDTVNFHMADTYFEMGRMYQLQGKYELAIKYAIMHEEILLRADKNNLSGLAYSAYDKGICYYHLGLQKQESKEENKASEYFNLAIDELTKALSLNMKMRGSIAVDTIDNESALGDVYAAFGSRDKALQYYNEAVVMTEKLLGKDCDKMEELKQKIDMLG